MCHPCVCGHTWPQHPQMEPLWDMSALLSLILWIHNTAVTAWTLVHKFICHADPDECTECLLHFNTMPSLPAYTHTHIVGCKGNSCLQRWIILKRDVEGEGVGLSIMPSLQKQNAPRKREKRARSRVVHVYGTENKWTKITKVILFSLCEFLLLFLPLNLNLSAWMSSLYAWTSCYECIHSLMCWVSFSL